VFAVNTAAAIRVISPEWEGWPGRLWQLATRLDRHSGQASECRRDPESGCLRIFRIPVFTGMAETLN